VARVDGSTTHTSEARDHRLFDVMELFYLAPFLFRPSDIGEDIIDA